MKKLILLFRLLKIGNGIKKFNWVSSSYHRQARALVNELTAPYDLASIPGLPSKTPLKLQWYMAEVLYVCENFNRLAGQSASPEQRRTYLLSGALGAFCDLIIDDVAVDSDRIKALKRPGPGFRPQNTVETLYCHCYRQLFDSLDADVKARTLHYYELMFDAQLKSQQQLQPTLTQAEADAVCKEKCGYSLLFLRALVNGPFRAYEEQAWFEVGAFIQYCNDAQDLPKDLAKNMSTFATTRPDLATIAAAIDQQKVKAFSLVKQTPFQESRKDDFLLALHVMGVGILAKLHAFHRLCDANGNYDQLAVKSKQEVRSAVKLTRLFPYAWPRIFTYRYETVDAPYPFDFNLPAPAKSQSP